MKNSKNLTGIAGTYYLAAELSRRGYVALVTIKNTSAVDLIVSSQENFNSIGIQVKTSQINKNQGWILSSKNENLVSENIIYVFVNLKTDNARPDFHIVPSKIVAETITNKHKKWLETLGKNDQPHNDSAIRTFYDNENIFKEKWDLIENKLDNPK
jgi:hypothetical protein